MSLNSMQQVKILNKPRPSRLLIVVSFLLLGLLLAACGELTPNGQTEQLLINEVFTGSSTNPSEVQWIEVLNNTNNDLQLSGYKISTMQGDIDLGDISANSSYKGLLKKGALLVVSNYPQIINDNLFKLISDTAVTKEEKDSLKRPPMPLEENKVLGKLDPGKDIIVLHGPTGAVIDQAGWGNLDQNAIKSMGVTSDINTHLPAPDTDTKSLGRTAFSGQRDPTDPGAINPGEFTLHNTPTPGLNSTPRTAASKNLVFTNVTDFIATLGGVLLWLAFIMIALIAKRFETLAEQKTYWQYLMVAPAGILIYIIIQVANFIIFGRLTDAWSWPAFLALFISGVACVYVVNIFRLIAKNILEAE
ncbi:MAG TPA: lamin tail domain-containing protein [Chloroflexia bacterium]|nr:lamin tail domain-containing protein [Chloroflexia bacterium]